MRTIFEVFDILEEYLRKTENVYCGQLGDGGCYYRSSFLQTEEKANLPHGCLIGILIPDEEYESDMDGCGGVESLLASYPELKQYLSNETEILSEIQEIHDMRTKGYPTREERNIAIRFKVLEFINEERKRLSGDSELIF